MLGKTFNLAPSAGFSGMQAGLAELFYTFLLTFVVLNTACSQKHAGMHRVEFLRRQSNLGFCENYLGRSQLGLNILGQF